MVGKAVCPYCGVDIELYKGTSKTWNIDHIIPRYVGRITGMPKDLLERDCNKVICHIKCNSLKGDLVPTKEYILAQHFAKDKMKSILAFHDEVSMYLDMFHYNIKFLYKKQKCSCFYCKDERSMNDLHICNHIVSKKGFKYKQILVCKDCLHKKGFKNECSKRYNEKKNRRA